MTQEIQLNISQVRPNKLTQLHYKPINMNELTERLNLFFDGVKKITHDYHRRSISDHNKSNNTSLPETLHDYPWELRTGKRYAKIIQNNSAHAFVDLTNGDVLKPESWSKPAKHARGNIFDEWNGLKWIDPYGPAYLR